MSVKRALDLGAPYGFEFSHSDGFVGMKRTNEDGTTERLDVFYWSNKKAAEAAGIPWAYVVFDIEGRRYRIPQVEWPSDTQERRPWADVKAEFDRVFGPVLNLPVGQRDELLAEIRVNPRYVII